MIRVTRLPTPKTLAKNADKWRGALLAADSPKKRRLAAAKYRQRDVKAALSKMFHGKCAYCESKITHVDYGHIEHFCPKGGTKGRPDLTFEWSNLMLACGICNGAEHKSDRFPGPDEGGPLVDPCSEEPETHFEFHFDPVVGLASVYGRTDRGATTERLLGLNRASLRAYRSQRVRHLAALARFADTDPEAALLLEEAQGADAEYAAFARTLFV